jgi:sigma-B regulation protein RsbU (phosphoserine phosphatase)
MPKELIEEVKSEIDNFVDGGEQDDDITMLVLKITEAKKTKKGFEKELTIEAKIENLDVVQNFIANELDKAGCSVKLENQIKLAVEEIFVNIANYAYGHVVGNVVIRLAAGDDIKIEFEDKGKPFNPLEKNDPDLTISVQEREIGGLGIFLVKKIMDKVEYRREDNKNILLISKKIV